MASDYRCSCGCNNNVVQHWKTLTALKELQLKPWPNVQLQPCPEVIEVVEPPREIIYKGFRYVLKENQSKTGETK